LLPLHSRSSLELVVPGLPRRLARVLPCCREVSINERGPVRIHAIMVPLTLLAVAGCAGTARHEVHDVLSQKGKVLREWTDGADDLVLVKEGNRVVKYRIYLISQNGV